MPVIANHIEILSAPRGYRLVVDGQEFPWHVGPEIIASQRRGGLSTVTLDLPADRVSFEPSTERSSITTDPRTIAEWFGPRRKTHREPDRTSRLARAEAARDQAEELLAKAQRALQENHETMEQLRAELAEAKSGKKVGTAYVEVRPDFSQFEAAVERVVERAEQRLARLGG